jgi:glutamyl-tRNA synthetase
VLETVPTANMPALIADVVAGYDDARSKGDWLAWMRAIVSRHGYAENAKEFKKQPSLYQGHFGDVAAVFRIPRQILSTAARHQSFLVLPLYLKNKWKS